MLKEGCRGAIQLDWGFPVHDHLRGYVQYFYHKVNKLGIGLKLTDWLQQRFLR
jgi:phospholipase A1